MTYVHCSECGEQMPPYSRICPYCCHREHFSVECREILNPEALLSMMRNYVYELRSIPHVGLQELFRDRYRVEILEIVASFEVVESVVNVGVYDKSDDIDYAVTLLNSILHDELVKRANHLRRLRIVVGVIIILIASLSVLIY